jgi:4-amino-4-deoxy-L-arabinose transferase-like glycosyltransferase
MLVFSQTRSFFWDEGFHILAAYLIHMGKRPYLDFFFPQTPLNAYWNAAWMAIFGPSWRVVHAVGALATIISVVLIVNYLYGLLPDHRWRQAAAFVGLALFGLHARVWMVGTISQAYPLCLLLVVVAFRLAIVAVARSGFSMSALAGLCAGAAAASSLLAAPASPVLLIWIWLYNRVGNRWIKSAAFVCGAIAAFIPVLRLFARGTHQVIFDILEYHTLYRRVSWPRATAHDIGVASDWINSSPDLLLVLLAVAGFFFIRKNGFEAARRAEFRLCLWLPVAFGAQNLLAHPTFPMYFVFMIPFLTVLAVIGFYAVAERLEYTGSPQAAAVVLAGISAVCLSTSIFENYSYTWPELEEVANKVMQVTPKDAALWAPEHIYFLSRWSVPSGMEHANAHKLQLSPAESAVLHVLPKAEVDRQIKAGAFFTAVVCEDEDQVNALKEWKVYSQSAVIQQCTVFWQVEKQSLQPVP